jgi:hypothetical protein
MPSRAPSPNKQDDAHDVLAGPETISLEAARLTKAKYQPLDRATVEDEDRGLKSSGRRGASTAPGVSSQNLEINRDSPMPRGRKAQVGNVIPMRRPVAREIGKFKTTSPRCSRKWTDSASVHTDVGTVRCSPDRDPRSPV